MVAQVIPIPWRGLLTSPPLWAIAFSEVGFNYMNFMMLMELPQYLVDVMHTDISEVSTCSDFNDHGVVPRD